MVQTSNKAGPSNSGPNNNERIELDEIPRVEEVRLPRVEVEPPRGRISEELGKDLKKVTPPKFDGKTIGDSAEAWIIEMEKYFLLRDLSDETKAIWAAYQLSGEATTWWDNERAQHNFQPGELTWNLFLQLFQSRWLPQHFFNSKIKEFQKLTQGNMTVTQYWEKFSHLLKYVPQYQTNENFRIRKLILGLRPQIGVEVEMHSPETMATTFEKATMQEQKNLKRNNTGDNKGQNFNKNFNNRGNNNYGNNRYNDRNNNGKDKPEYKMGHRGGCFICRGKHYANQCDQHTVEKRREIQPHHQIHAAVDNRQVDFQASPIQLDGKLFGHAVSILIDTGATECFVDPRVVSKLNVKPSYMSKPWNVQYGNWAERRVDQCLACSELLLSNFLTELNLYVAPLGSYDVILGINWLIEHKAIVNCEDKLVECFDDLGNQVKIQGDKKPLQLRQISAMQLKKAQRKGCEIYSVYIKDLREDNTGLDTHPIL
ncbi:uncharacterized protein LOC131874001 [Cryptomeria japonica]|uniref:uncharacterized protein LOC131874001 n=1 Tax=Cryptomeria japonica TaxID=3369 RepID=UPI0027DA9D42|nr:uncharacterized protein LOC131874001 [Cryptomeria japonica]